MTAEELLLMLQRAKAINPRQFGEATACVRTYQPGRVGGAAVAGVESVGLGIDWDSRKLMIYPTGGVAALSEPVRNFIDMQRKEAEEKAYAEFEARRKK